MRVFLFLDIDLVLRPYKALAEGLARFPEVRVVVSSTPGHVERVQDLQERLALLPVVDVTGPRIGARYEDLKEYAYCSEWLALDYNDRGWPEEERWRLIRCDAGRGFGARESRELEAKLSTLCHEHIMAPMQTERSTAGLEALFRASPDELGQAAVRAAQKLRRT